MIDSKDEKRWDGIVKSFPDWDVYYLCAYARAFMLHGDGEPLLFLYEEDGIRFCDVVMKRDVAGMAAFQGLLEPGTYYDLETPYGYGGPLISENVTGSIPADLQNRYKEQMGEYCREQKIVSEFVRFHPFLGNHDVLSQVIESRYMRDTIFIDTSDEERIMQNMDSKNRNMVRKAIKSGVTVVQKPITEYNDFMYMYEKTMQRDHADPYFYFEDAYYKANEELAENAMIFYAIYDEKPISGAIMYFNERNMHYHLSGSLAEYRNLAPSNLLLYEAAKWAAEHGIQRFHLGGGMAPDDSLFRFKKQFNKNGKLPFWVGRIIFDKKAYEELLHIRKAANSEFDVNNNRMIQYTY